MVPVQDPLTREVAQALTQATVVPVTGRAPLLHPGRRPADLPSIGFRAYISDEPLDGPSPPASNRPSRLGVDLRSPAAHPLPD